MKLTTTLFIIITFFFCSTALGQTQFEWEAKWDAYDALEWCEEAQDDAQTAIYDATESRNNALVAKAACTDPLYLGSGNSFFNLGENAKTFGWQEYYPASNPRHSNASAFMVLGDAAWESGNYTEAINNYVQSEYWANLAKAKYNAARDWWTGENGAQSHYDEAKEQYELGVSEE